MPIYGDLSDLPLHILLQALTRAGQTGRLTLRTRVEEVTLVLDRGRIAAVLSSDAQLRLGQMLLQLGDISEEQLEQALALQAVTDGRRRLGQILTELGFVTHQQIKRALAQQFEEVLVRVLGAADASFAFVPEPPLIPDEETALDDAIRRADERRAGVRLTTGPIDRSMLDRLLPEERAVLIAVLEGQRTEQQLVEATGLPRATLREVLDRLVSARLLERAG
jgi:hypothetical protein